MALQGIFGDTSDATTIREQHVTHRVILGEVIIRAVLNKGANSGAVEKSTKTGLLSYRILNMLKVFTSRKMVELHWSEEYRAVFSSIWGQNGSCGILSTVV